MNKPKIIKTDWGLASNYGDTIELNRKLDSYPLLKDKILKHELSHSPGAYSLRDYKIDYKSEKPYFYESIMFAIKNPETLIGFFPIMYSYFFKMFTFNFGALFIFAVWGLIYALLCTLIFKVSFLLAFLMWICIYIFINLVLLAYTHFYVRKQILTNSSIN